MNKKKIDYNRDLQKLLIEFMISDPTIFMISRTIIHPEYWDREFRRSVEFIIDYVDNYKSLPTPAIVKAETSQNYETLKIDDKLSNWYYDTIENFCKHKAMEKLIMDGPELLEKGLYAEIEERSKQNVLISLQKELGTDYFEDPKTRLEALRDKSNMVSTGWKTIDNPLYGGINRGELTFFAGGPGTGKSLFLQNLAVNWCLMGLNVLYVTLELSENLVSLRLDAMFTKETTKDVVKDIDNAALKLLSIKKGKTETGIKPGRIQIKKFSEAGTTVNDIRAYIKEFEVQTGLKIDALCLDYLDLLYPNSSKVDINNTFSKDKYTSEELRGLAAELNILCVTASQLNRCLTLDTEVMWIDPSTPITDYRKTKKKLSEIQIGDYILGNNDFVEVVNIYNQGTQKVYKVTLENGKEIKCTSNHRFLTDKGLISIDEGMDIGVNLITYKSFKPTYRSLVLEKHVTTEYSAIEKIEYHGLEDTIDIEVLSESNLFYANDILTHNSSVSETDYDVSHIAGGISKINTADNVIAILTTEYLRQSGEYQIQFLKTRSSNGVGSRIYLSYDQKSLKIDDKIEGNTDLTSNKKDNEKLSDMLEKRLLSKKKTTEEPKNKEIKTEIIEKPKEAAKDSRLDIIKKLSNKE